MWRMWERIWLQLCRSSFLNCSQRLKSEMSASGTVQSSQLKLSVFFSLKAVQQSNLQVRHSKCRLSGALQRVNNILFHQETIMLYMSSQILNQLTKINLSLMPQWETSRNLVSPVPRARGNTVLEITCVDNWRFQPEWYKQYPWLSYNVEKDVCMFCLHRVWKGS